MCNVYILPSLGVGGAEAVLLKWYVEDIKKGLGSKLILLTGAISTKKRMSLEKDISSDGLSSIIELKARMTGTSLLSLFFCLKQIEKPHIVATHLRVITLCRLLVMVLPGMAYVARCPTTISVFLKENNVGLIARVIYRSAFINAGRVIAQTNGMRRDLIELGWSHPDKTAVLGNPSLFDFGNNAITKYHLTHKRGRQKLIVASGRLCWAKGFDVLIQAFKQVHTANPNCVLLILGQDQGAGRSLKKLINSLELRDAVFLLGHIPNPIPYYLSANVFVLSSRREGSPNSLRQNVLLGTPCAAYRVVEEVGSVIEQGQNGYIVDILAPDTIAEAIKKALSMSRRGE